MLFKKLSGNNSVKWIGYTGFYLLILLLLFFIYGFHTANTGSFIYNDF
ncbi:teichoic acid D-Ala incorporation-associated protein DltX [Bacillus pumilus]|nr:teichoic acid D-Ala incorporation-associated protein DltX [Bacillus pumilus]